MTAVITTRDKARYYPGARELTLKLVADSPSGRLLSAQAVGFGAVDKMIDIAATALLVNLTCQDLEHADLAYAPALQARPLPYDCCGERSEQEIRLFALAEVR